jgi:hypothetical protein
LKYNINKKTSTYFRKRQTSDKKTIKKTKAVYQSEGINTLVFKPKEFVEFLQENQ